MPATRQQRQERKRKRRQARKLRQRHLDDARLIDLRDALVDVEITLDQLKLLRKRDQGRTIAQLTQELRRTPKGETRPVFVPALNTIVTLRRPDR